MKSKAEPPLSGQIRSRITVWFLSIVSGLVVFAFAIFLQWLIYDDWMHSNGPLRLVGSAFASVLMFLFTFRWQLIIRRRKIEMLRRFERIKWMNDRIRNSLQAIECVTYATNPQATNPVRDAVDVIENILQEVLVEAHPTSTTIPVRQSAQPLSMKPSA